MADTKETVFIEFVVDDKQLESAQQNLERTGKIDKQSADQFKATNAELARRQKTIDALNKQLRDTQTQNAKTIADLEARMQNFIQDFVAGFGEGVVETLKEAGFEFDEFGKLINKNKETVKSAGKSLKGELRAITQELAAMKLRGEDNTEQYDALAKKAGEMRDAIADAGQEVKNFGSDTRHIDGLINLAQGVAGGFALAQGAEGLFGTQSEELNETLVKVNSSLAFLQGLQQIGNVLQKESAASTFIQTAAQKIYNVVIGESIGLMAAFRVALASTGVGLLIIGIIALVQALDKANKETEQANRLLERNKNVIDADTEAIKRNTDEQIARAEAVNAKESEIIKLRGHGLVLQRAAILEANKQLQEQRDTLDVTSEAYIKLNQEIENNNELIKDIDNKTIIEKINLDKQLRTEQLQGIVDTLQAQLDATTKNSKKEFDLAKQTARAKAAVELNEAGDNLEKRLAIEAALQKEIRAINLQYAQVRQQDRVSAAENELLKVQQVSQEISARQSQDEINAQKNVIAQKARLDLLQEGLTENQKLQIRKQALAEQLKLQKDFNKQSAEDAINDLISRNNAELTQLNLTNKERISIEEDNLIAQAQLEIDANKGLTDKIKEIRAKLNEDLRALRLAALQKELNDELALTEARTGALRRANERVAANENKSLGKRLAAVNQLAALDIANINKREDALDESLKRGLISQQDYNLQYAQLKDEELEITENAEQKKRDITKQNFLKILAFAADAANQVLGIVQQFGQQQTEAEQQRIDEQRQRIDDLKEAGAISEKEAEQRNKRLDQEERALKRRQAQRDRNIALFQAVINTAAAVARALAEGGPILAAIVAALGAAQITLIASRPIPKFGKGKKDNYEGPAEIGDTGPELWQHNGKMYLAKKSSFVWMGKQDKVFNPKETVAMLEKNNMQPYIIKDADTQQYKSVYNTQIDYDKLGSTIAKNIPQVGLDINEKGITHWVRTGNALQTYLDNRRSYK